MAENEKKSLVQKLKLPLAALVLLAIGFVWGVGDFPPAQWLADTVDEAASAPDRGSEIPPGAGHATSGRQA